MLHSCMRTNMVQLIPCSRRFVGGTWRLGSRACNIEHTQCVCTIWDTIPGGKQAASQIGHNVERHTQHTDWLMFA